MFVVLDRARVSSGHGVYRVVDTDTFVRGTGADTSEGISSY